MGRPLAGFALVLTVSVLLASCATDTGNPEGRDGPPGRGRGGPGMGQPPSRFDGGWKAYDLNGDGRVTRAEFSAVRNLCFVRVDGNGDGLLTRQRSSGCGRANLGRREIRRPLGRAVRAKGTLPGRSTTGPAAACGSSWTPTATGSSPGWS